MISSHAVLGFLLLGVLLTQQGAGLEAYDAEAAAGAAAEAAAEQAWHINEAGQRSRPSSLGGGTKRVRRAQAGSRKAAAEALVSIAALEPLAAIDHRGSHSHRARRQHPKADHRGSSSTRWSSVDGTPGGVQYSRGDSSSSSSSEQPPSISNRGDSSLPSPLSSSPERRGGNLEPDHRAEPSDGADSSSSSQTSEQRRASDDAGSSSGVSSGGSSGGSSIGRITQWRKLLTVYYEGGAGDSGTQVTPSLASATVHWGLVASSPHFDNAPSAKADGEWGFWSINADQDVPLVQAPGQSQPYIRIEGNASYPESVTMVGQLSSILAAIPTSDIDTDIPSTRTALQGEPPPHFLTSTQREMALTVCEYSGPCNWAVEPNLGPMMGRLSMSPAIEGSYSITDLINRKWVPQGTVEITCTLNRGQEKLVECPPTKSM